MKLSVIIPYCNEYPQIVFTVQNIISELGEDNAGDFEIITIDNMSTDKGYKVLKNSPFERRTGILKNIQYNGKLGHWNAKNAGIEASKGERLLFLDGHIIIKKNSIREMLDTKINGSLHMQICYMLDPKRLIYRTKREEMGYRFASSPAGFKEPFQVPVMSTCGMMVERKLIDELGAWNKELGIYGGGENYMMYKIATCGYPIEIHPAATLFHFAEKRGYSWNYDDYVRNQFIAGYCVGGEEWLTYLAGQRIKKPGNKKEVIDRIANDVREKCAEDRKFIKSKQVISMSDYFDKWEGRYFEKNK